MSNTIKQVRSFQSSNGVLHATKKEALEAEFAIELRGLIQKIATPAACNSLNSTQVANILKNHNGVFIDTMRKYKEMIRRATPIEKVAIVR